MIFDTRSCRYKPTNPENPLNISWTNTNRPGATCLFCDFLQNNKNRAVVAVFATIDNQTNDKESGWAIDAGGFFFLPFYQPNTVIPHTLSSILKISTLTCNSDML